MSFLGSNSNKRGLITLLGQIFLVLSILLVVGYQVYTVLHTNPNLPFIEPDNYEYYLFAQLAVSHNTLNVSNPYVIQSSLTNHNSKFFESPGLYQAPVILHWLLPVIPLMWDFRIIYSIVILSVYGLTLLIAKKLLDNPLILKGYKNFSYSLILISFILMQQSQIIEWRGTLFIVAFQLAILYLMSYIFTSLEQDQDQQTRTFKHNLNILLSAVGIVLFIIMSWYFWSGWYVNLVITIALIILFTLYYFTKKVGNLRNILYKLLVILLIIIPTVVLFFTNYFVVISVGLINKFYIMPSCLTNPLNLSEVACLNASNGLFVVALDLFFGCFILLAFFLEKLYGSYKRKYEYAILGSIFLILIQLPLVVGYVRLIQLIAPYLTIIFSIGAVALFIRSGSRRGVNILVMFMIFVSSAFGMFVYASSVNRLYTLDNPIGLYNIASQLSPNSTIFTFYGYGDIIEQVGNAKVYSDTIQALNVSVIEQQDNILLDNYSTACISINNNFSASNYVLVSPMLENYTIFANATNESIIKNPLSLNKCSGYSLINENNSFYLFRR